MLEPITLTVGELAARWRQTPRQVLQFALHHCFPMYFYFDGLVFDAADEWHRTNGAWLENQKREQLEKSIAAGEAQLRRHLQYVGGGLTLSEWEQPMNSEDVQACRQQVTREQAELKRLREVLDLRDAERLTYAHNGLVRAAPGTLQAVLERGGEPFPRWGFHPDKPVHLVTRGGNHLHMDGHLWALEDARYPKERITADDLQARIEDVKAAEAAHSSRPNSGHAEPERAVTEPDSHRMTDAPTLAQPPAEKNAWDEPRLRKLLDESREPGITQKMLGERYGVSRQQIAKALGKARENFGRKKATPFDGLSGGNRKT